jgi:hypothetical protein
LDEIPCGTSFIVIAKVELFVYHGEKFGKKIWSLPFIGIRSRDHLFHRLLPHACHGIISLLRAATVEAAAQLEPDIWIMLEAALQWHAPGLDD